MAFQFTEPTSAAAAHGYHDKARGHAEKSLTCLSLAAWYSSEHHRLDPQVAAEKAERKRAESKAHGHYEADALRDLNHCLLGAGANPGEEAEIGRHTYRVAHPHNLACYLGAFLPADFDFGDEITRDEEVAEWKADYARSVHPTGF